MGHRGVGIVVGALAIGGFLVGVPDARSAAPSGLPVVASGARPGPDVLYADAPVAPQLENRDSRFRADPILVMGQEAYVDGEYLYQDWIYDDNGSDSGLSDAGGTDTAGDVSYPDDPAYGGNAADLVELRIAPGVEDVSYRFTLNTLLEEDSSVVALAFDTDRNAATGLSTPHESGMSFTGADQIITARGGSAEHTVVGGATTPVTFRTDLEANQLTLVVPRLVSNPTGTWDASLAVGLNDGSGGWLRPAVGPLDPTPSGVYDLGLTFDEAPAGITAHDAKQAVSIRDKTAPRRAIDFGALRDNLNSTTVPTSGTMGRIYPSRINFGEGKDYDDTPEIHGQLQPYSIYVPTTYSADDPSPLMLDLHSLGEHFWQYNASVGVQQIGEQRDAIVIGCECRGEDGWYLDEAEYDVFEMWNDVARHFVLDADRVGITGYSMGGYATYRLASLYPDLFAKALSIVGPPTAGIWVPPYIGADETLTNHWLENVRNIPFLNAVAVPDELVPYYGTRTQNLGAPEHGINGFEQLGYRYRFLSYPTAEHLTIGVLKYDLPYQKDFLGDTLVDRNPYHVTFRYVPAADNADLGLVHDHAYWVSGIKLASDEGELPSARVDVVSQAFGKGDPTSTQGQTAGHGPLPYVEVNRSWGEAPSIPVENKLTLNLDNVGEVTIDLARAGLHLDGLDLDARSDGPAVVHLVDGDVTRDAHVDGGVVIIDL